MSNPSSLPVIKKLLDDNKQSLNEALPRHIPVQKLIRVMVTQLSVNPALQKCTQQSLIGALLECCLYGLEPDGRDAALVPYFNGKTKCTEAKFIPMYTGELKIARRSGEIALVYADVVKKNDKFEIKKGLNPDLIHIPSITDGGATLGAYAVIKLKSGEADFIWMTKDDIEKVRNSSKAKNAGPWCDWWDEMAKKTALKRILKQAPKASETQNESNIADNVYKGLQALPLLTPEQEAQDYIDPPKRTLEPEQEQDSGPEPDVEQAKMPFAEGDACPY